LREFQYFFRQFSYIERFIRMNEAHIYEEKEQSRDIFSLKPKKILSFRKGDILVSVHYNHLIIWSLPREVKDEGERSGVLRILRGIPLSPSLLPFFEILFLIVESDNYFAIKLR